MCIAVEPGLAGQAQAAGISPKAFSLQSGHWRQSLSAVEDFDPAGRAEPVSATEVTMIGIAAEYHVEQA